MRDHVPVRRCTARADANQQRAVEPAAILVRAFEIHVRRPGRPLLAVRTARCEEPESNHTSRMSFSLRHFAAPHEQFVPAGSNSSAECVYQASAPSRSNQWQHVAQRREILELLAAPVAIENDQRHAPESLARNAPVRPLRDHLVHALAPQAGVHFTLAISSRALLRGWPPSIETDEPLLGGAENHRDCGNASNADSCASVFVRRAACRARVKIPMTMGFASKTVLPLYSGKPSTKRPSSSSGA